MAIDLTGISNVNEFYSHHYLDSLLEGDLKGLYSKWKEDERTPDKKLSGLSGEYFKVKSNALNETNAVERLEITQPFYYNFLDALGYSVQAETKFNQEGIAIPTLSAVQKDGNEYLWMIQTSFLADEENVFEQAFVHTDILYEDVKYFEGSVESVIQEIFRIEAPPRWLMLLAGQKVYLIDRTKWGQGKYLLFNLDEIFGRKQVETLKATAALLSKDALAPEEGSVLHDELEEKSHKHAFSVSEDLKYGIRRAVELIGNEFIYYRSQVSKKAVYDDAELASKLTKEALTYLYRLLFLFYAESRSEELDVVPMKSEEYRLGYSLESLRELEQVPLTTEAARNSYYLNESLNTLFKIVNDGYGNDQFELDLENGQGTYVDMGFSIDGLQSPLFNPKQTLLLSSVKFRNFVLQEVIQLLSLSKEGRKQRGRISYAQLGINQLGAVYEGLLSYSGFFAQETLYEVKPASESSTDETGQSYFVPASDFDEYDEKEFVYIEDTDGTKKRKRYEKGSFIFRLAGRDREKTASYYTPEVLTKSLVKYSLKELLKSKTADEILQLKVCEPAMGSGAFLNEAINQLADAYLECKQKELDQSINPEEYTHERQRVKAYIATNNIYGVDLNPTAAELAKVSLWLNTIYNGSNTPWFSARLAVGNSLIGVRRQGFKENDLVSGKWHNKVPEKISFDDERKEDTIYHFLIPDKGMVAFDKDKVIKEVAKEHIEYIKRWRNDFTKKFDLQESNTLKNISKRIDELWRRHTESRSRLFEITKEPINIWGRPKNESEERQSLIEKKEEELGLIKTSPTSPYSALKMVMDYWCTLWFWPIEKSALLPTRDEFLLDISVILDAAQGFGPNINELCNSVERLTVVKEVSRRTNFLHWELEFAEVFKDDNGFDLIIGNPPWIKVLWEEKDILSEKFPNISLRNLSAQRVGLLRNSLIESEETRREYLKEFTNSTGQKAFLSSYLYEVLQGTQLNLYKLFMILSADISKTTGIISFIHLEGIYDDAQGNKIRKYLYKKLIFHFQFINELKLFSDIGNQKKIGISIFRAEDQEHIKFINVSNLFHPKTLDESFNHNGIGVVPGIKTKDFQWDIKGHKKRLIYYDEKLLNYINKMFEEEGTSIEHTKIVNIHSTDLSNVIKKLAGYENKLVEYKNEIYQTEMFHETNDQKNNNIERNTYVPDNIKSLVYSGPHFYVANPLFQTPNDGCKSHRDYSKINLPKLGVDYLPRTNYKITKHGEQQIEKWRGQDITRFYRQIFRKMLSPTGERTLIGAIIPKGPSHINGCVSYAIQDKKILALFSGMSSTIILDFYIRSTGRSNLSSVVFNLPIPSRNHILNTYIISRTLRLNCVSECYKELWEALYDEQFVEDTFTKVDLRMSDWKTLGKEWTPKTYLKNDFERRQALVELDVLAALVLGLNIEEIIALYNMQFPVLQKYEAENRYDQRGMLVPKNILKYYEKQSDEIAQGDPNLEGFILPFDKCDREADMRQAYDHFSEILKENS